MTESKIPPRPKYDDPRVIIHAIIKILPDVNRWFDRKGKRPRPTDTVVALSASYDDDSFVFAKNLEAAGWKVDANLVAALAKINVGSAHSDVLQAWMVYHNVFVPFMRGDAVTTSSRGATVTSVHEMFAEIEIGDPVKGGGYTGGGYTYIETIPFEEATLLPDVPRKEVSA
tara:strand:+ start:3550 stop:4062 length:513 start_codon:yes stop_codon:yes gene_type:complete